MRATATDVALVYLVWVITNYVSDDSPHAKIQKDCPIGGVLAYACIITLAWFLVFYSFPSLFVTLNFARVPSVNRKTNFYAVCFV